MERQRKAGPRVTTSRLDPTEYDASPFEILMYPNIGAFTEHAQIVVAYMEPVGAMAITPEGTQTIAMLRRRKDESFKQLLDHLDTAIANATINDVYVGEVNVPRN